MRGQEIIDEKSKSYPRSHFLDGINNIWEKYNEDEHGKHNERGSNLECSGGVGEQGFK